MTRPPQIPGGIVDGFTGDWYFLSNFSPSPITIDKIQYPTVEHAFQAHKTTDMVTREFIAGLPTPGHAKRAGWNLPATSPLRPDWNDVRVRTMRDLIKLKFAPGGDLTRKLIETYPARLVEANNWHDNFWGDCRCGRPGTCRADGVNQLGKDLVVWRDHLIHRRRRS